MEHHVYFWLKEEYQNEAGRARMEAALEQLVTSPNVARAHWGRPAGTAERPVTDHSWDYGISFHFDSLEAHEKYQKDDPIHDGFSGPNKEMWAKVLVMDLT
ncbi:MAG: Dabb family protein [Verrucomicrobiales bacterium]